MGACSSNKQGPPVDVAALRAALEAEKQKSVEQQNLLRFKIEVMVNMLAMEEKKNETATKRIETLKWAMLEQGVSEQRLLQILSDPTQSVDNGPADSKPSERIPVGDLSGAISRTATEFGKFRNDIIYSFATQDGKLVNSLTADEFMKQLYTVTEDLRKSDIQTIAMRFGDGSGYVSIPDFLEFFTTPEQVRTAKASAAAVRMSLDLLQMEQEEEQELHDDVEGVEVDENMELVQISSHRTEILDRAVTRLIGMWPTVQHKLEESFANYTPSEIHCDEENVLLIDEFVKILFSVCGQKSHFLQNLRADGKIHCTDAEACPLTRNRKKSLENTSAQKDEQLSSALSGADEEPSSEKKLSIDISSQEAKPKTNKLIHVQPIDMDDATFIAERFELGGFVHYGHFVQYFKEASLATIARKRNALAVPPSTVSASPFYRSSEWRNLKKTATAPVLPPIRESPAPQPPTIETKKESPAVPDAAPKQIDKPYPLKNQDRKSSESIEDKIPEPKEEAPRPTPGPEVVGGGGCCGGSKNPPASAPASAPAPAPVVTTDHDVKVPEPKNHAMDEKKDDKSSPPPVKEDKQFDTPPKAKRVFDFKPTGHQEEFNFERDGLTMHENLSDSGAKGPHEQPKANNTTPHTVQSQSSKKGSRFHKKTTLGEEFNPAADSSDDEARYRK